MDIVGEGDRLQVPPHLFIKDSNYLFSISRYAAHAISKTVRIIQTRFPFITRLNYRLIGAIIFISTILYLLSLSTAADKQTRIAPSVDISYNITQRWSKSANVLNSIESLPLPSIISSYRQQKSHCSVEVYGFEGVEQDYISGTLLRDIGKTCSCYTHYRKLENFVNDTLAIEASTSLDKVHNIARLIWCIGQCPDFIFNHCINETHRDFCQKHVVLIHSDEQLVHRVDQYPYFAAVYRNYLRRDTANHLTYLTKYLRKIPQTNESSNFHRILNWSLAIDITKKEWSAAGVDIDDVSANPSSDVLTQINNRVVKRLLLNNEGITYHTWPDLDTNTKNQTGKDGSVFWIPLGHTFYYLASAAKVSVGPLSKRLKLWSWSGSIKFNEREDMKKALEQTDLLTDYIKKRGLFTMTGGFAEGPHHMDYTSQLLDSQFIPLPRGSAPEQFRSHEAANSGAILIVNDEWLKIEPSMEMKPLAYLKVLGYDPVIITNFTTLPKILLQLSRLPPELLDDWQSIMLLRHTIVMHTVTKHMASVLCAATTPGGYVYKKTPDILTI